MEIKKRFEWVKQKLTKYPKLRDSNARLYYNLLKDMDYDTGKSIKDFLKDMEKGEVPYIDYIGRTSRRVQEEYAQLRGTYYGKRKRKAKVVKHEIRHL